MYSRQLIFSKSNEFTPSFIKLHLTRAGHKKQIVENCLKYLPLETQTLEETIQIMEHPFSYIRRNPNSKWNHPFVSKEQPNEPYIPYSQCKICGEELTKHKSLVHNRKNHSLPKKCSCISDDKAFILKETFANKRRADSPLLKRIGIIDYNINSFECEICLDQLPEDKKENILCGHQFCKDCIIEHLVQCISTAKVPITCPDIKCIYEFDNDFVRKMVPREYDKYKKFLKRKEIAKIKNAIVCPIPNCESYAIIHKEEENEDKINNGNVDTVVIYKDISKSPTQNNNKDNQQTERNNSFQEFGNENDKFPIVLKCIDNGHEFCSKCKQLPHPPLPCSSTEEEKWVKYKNESNIKKCPFCGIEISKNEGCNHIRCLCGYEFCWLCGREYTPIHYSAPFSSCYHKQFDRDVNIIEAEHTNKCVLFLQKIGTILLIILIISVAFALAGFVFVGFILYHCIINDILSSMNRWYCITYVILFAMSAFLGIAMLPFGYLIDVGIILFLPLEIYYHCLARINLL